MAFVGNPFDLKRANSFFVIVRRATRFHLQHIYSRTHYEITSIEYLHIPTKQTAVRLRNLDAWTVSNKSHLLVLLEQRPWWYGIARAFIIYILSSFVAVVAVVVFDTLRRGSKSKLVYTFYDDNPFDECNEYTVFFSFGLLFDICPRSRFSPSLYVVGQTVCAALFLCSSSFACEYTHVCVAMYSVAPQLTWSLLKMTHLHFIRAHIDS